jgi:mRNA interferase RelE/StbE
VVKYRILIKRSASKELEGIAQKKDRQRIVAPIQALTGDPRPPGCEKPAGSEPRYRIRQGNYRVVYSIDDAQLVVTIFKVGHRR